MSPTDPSPDSFERLYAAGVNGRSAIPWSREAAHPLLAEWTEHAQVYGTGLTAIVVGCALGSDAEHLAGLGFHTTAFDGAPTAVALARHRNPSSSVNYVVADILDPPPAWDDAFDLVVEIVTVQALPLVSRARAVRNFAGLVAPNGTPFVIAAVEDRADRAHADGPIPLTREEIDSFASHGLTAIAAEPVQAHRGEWRWRAEFHRPSAFRRGRGPPADAAHCNSRRMQRSRPPSRIRARRRPPDASN